MNRPVDDPLVRALSGLHIGPGTRAWIGVALRPATVLTLMLVAAAAIPESWVTSGPSLCPFKVLTGLPCPGCGMTRGVATLMHGDLGLSLYYHPLAIAVVVACVGLALVDAWVWFRPKSLGAGRVSPSWLPERLMATPAPWVAIGALTVVWAIRLPLYLAGSWVF